MNVLKRITSLRSLMHERGIDACIITGTDPHLSEYVPDAWKSREWISGFSGSYGKVVITQDRAALWTDSRYFIQAEMQLSGSGITLMRDRQENTVSVDQWLAQNINQGSVVAIDGLTIPATEEEILKNKLGAKGITLNVAMDLVSPVWENRPSLPGSTIMDYPVSFAGEARSEKLARIRNRLTNVGAAATLICQLDDLAWTFNLRGNDISFNPFFTGYGYIDLHQAILFVEEKNLSEELIELLRTEDIHIRNYKSIFSFLEKEASGPFYVDPDRTNALICGIITNMGKVIKGMSIPMGLKAIKNQVEIAGMREAHVRDGAAMVNFLYWFATRDGKDDMTELGIAQKIKSFRSEQDFFMGESFSPIVAFGSNGAIVHYNATSETNAHIVKDGILLIDSGGQYLDGTTDITRTISTGQVTAQHQTDFTLVLKGMIQLATAIFPEGTKGYSLDMLARNALWRNGLNYGHGTGHGVGHFLCVHEGPMSIRPDHNNEPIREGHILTDEPGLYREGEYGFRIENVLVCTRAQSTGFGDFLSFDTLTLCPIDRNLIDVQLLTPEEFDWLNNYHARVFAELAPRLNQASREWLRAQCAPL